MRTTYRQRQARNDLRTQARRAPVRAGQTLGKTYVLAETEHITARELAGGEEAPERLCFEWCDSDR